MRIAQIAPLIESVPPALYGGTERVVSYLTEELVRRGHQVTLYASGDSETTAELRAVWPRSTRLDPIHPDADALHLLQLTQAFDPRERFDIIHCHVDYFGFPFARASAVPSVHTLHGRLDLPHYPPLLTYFRDVPLVSISNDQRRPLAGLDVRWMGTIPHGLPEWYFHLGSGKGGYLVYVSRLSEEKGPDLAIEVAKRSGVPLKMAGKVDEADKPFFEKVVRPLLDDPLVEFIGEIGDAEKPALVGSARAILFPIDWPEPFGLAMIEAMAFGTPVIARPYGAVPEVIDEGVTGFLADTPEEMVRAVQRVGRLDRERCQRRTHERFSVGRMADQYEAVYERLIRG